MECDADIQRRMHRMRREARYVILDVEQYAWHPSLDELTNFWEGNYLRLVRLHKRWERTQEVLFTMQYLMARENETTKPFAYMDGAGFTRSEAAATHTIGWELKSISDWYEKHCKPFDLWVFVEGITKYDPDAEKISKMQESSRIKLPHSLNNS